MPAIRAGELAGITLDLELNETVIHQGVSSVCGFGVRSTDASFPHAMSRPRISASPVNSCESCAVGRHRLPTSAGSCSDEAVRALAVCGCRVQGHLLATCAR